VFRCLIVTVAVVLAIPGQSSATVNIWLSGVGTMVPGSSFPLTSSAVPVLEPYLGGPGSIYIWGRPDASKSLADISLNLVAETQPVCSTSCVIPNAVAFASATVFNEPFGMPSVVRFEYINDSTGMPPLPIDANRIDGMDGLRIFEGGEVRAVGIGSFADPYYDAAHNSWLIAKVTYNVLATGENTATRLFLEIGSIGLNHTGETTANASVIFGDATDQQLNGHDDRGIHPGNFDALIRPRPLPGDADRNGVVATADFNIWRTNFGSTTQLAADHNKNGIVDAADYTIWRDNLGRSAGSAAASLAVPEPCATALLSVAMSALFVARRLSFSRAK